MLILNIRIFLTKKLILNNLIFSLKVIYKEIIILKILPKYIFFHYFPSSKQKLELITKFKSYKETKNNIKKIKQKNDEKEIN